MAEKENKTCAKCKRETPDCKLVLVGSAPQLGPLFRYICGACEPRVRRESNPEGR